MHLWGGALLHLKWALRRFNGVQGTLHKVSGPLTPDVRRKISKGINMTWRDDERKTEQSVKSCLGCAFAFAFVLWIVASVVIGIWWGISI